jgi:hypothetical protein
VVIGISDQFQIPVKYIGVGEKMEDLQIFNGRICRFFFKKRVKYKRYLDKKTVSNILKRSFFYYKS